MEGEAEGVLGSARPPPGAGQAWPCGQVVWLAQAPPRPLLPPIRCPDVETLSPRSNSTKQFVAAAISIPRSGDSKLFPAPCRRGEFTLEAFFITMQASGVMRE